MIIDSRAEIGASGLLAGTQVYDAIDLGAGYGFSGQPILNIQMIEAAVGAGTATFSLETANTADMSGSRALWISGPLGSAKLSAGVLVGGIPIAGRLSRYVALRVTVSGGAFTAGKFRAAFVQDASLRTVYPDGVN